MLSFIGILDDVHKDLLASKDKPFFNNYKSGIVTYGPDYEQEVRQEQEMIDASRARLSSFGRVHDYISHVNGEIQKWLTPVRHLPASPESSDHEEPSRADFGLPPVFHPIGTTNRPSRLGTFLYPGADKKRRLREKTSCSAFPTASDVQDTTNQDSPRKASFVLLSSGPAP